MPEEIFIVRNRITLEAATLDCSEVAFRSDPFSKMSPGNTGGRVIIFVKLQTDCSTANHFENFFRKYRCYSPSFGQITDWLFRVAITY